jgi:photosystem II stability/assembly factor-like uncharacterized protein
LAFIHVRRAFPVKNTLSIVVLGLLLGSFLSVASAQQVQSMKLLTPQIGWAESGQHLYWTTDDGAHWKDIAPKKSSEENIGGVFFLDASHGWVVLSHPDKEAELQFRIAATEDAGATWASSPIKLPWERLADDFAGGADLFFLDKDHGWADLDLKSSSSFAPGRLLASQDGGKTWQATSGDPGRAGFLCFFSERDGVLAGGPQGTELYLTHDGSKSWQELSLKAPPEAAPADFPTYGEPQCRNGKDGFLPVTYSGADGSASALVLFATEDGGRIWRPDRLLPHLGETSAGETVPSAIVGSELIAAPRTTASKTLELMKIPSLGRSNRIATPIAGSGSVQVSRLSFVSESTGWAATWNGLFSTTDGGVTWTNISAGGPPIPIAP